MKMEVTQDIMDYLKSKDSIFEMLDLKYGLISLELDKNIFESIVLNILGQMLSKNVADKITNRFLNICGNEITAEAIKNIDVEEIRACGASYAKAKYIKEFAERYINNEFDFSVLERMNDIDTIKYLRQIKGVGLWTAEMLSLFCLGRENIFSYNDIALKNGIMKAKGFKTLSNKRFEALRKKYSPFCSYASLYFYRFNDDKENS